MDPNNSGRCRADDPVCSGVFAQVPAAAQCEHRKRRPRPRCAVPVMRLQCQTRTMRSRHQPRMACAHRQTRATHSDSRRPDVQVRTLSNLLLLTSSTIVSLVFSTTTRSPRLTTRSPRLTARIHAGESPPIIAESQYGSISRAPAREPRMCSPQKKQRNHFHIPHRKVSAAACEGEKGRTGVSNTVSPLRPRFSMRTRRSRPRLQGRAREERLPASTQAPAASLRTPRIDSHWRAAPNPLARSRGTPPGPA
ncbi:hypothetical protein C8J57DRAFT_215208 [Mycena rebaudengoi]|nr:hypothetical protein C8J57DRAFT_215208 [Mycena rebaudengoi]